MMTHGNCSTTEKQYSKNGMTNIKNEWTNNLLVFFIYTIASSISFYILVYECPPYLLRNSNDSPQATGNHIPIYTFKWYYQIFSLKFCSSILFYILVYEIQRTAVRRFHRLVLYHIPIYTFKRYSQIFLQVKINLVVPFIIPIFVYRK